MDIIGSIELEDGWKINLLDIIDNSTQFSELQIMSKTDSNEVVKILESFWLFRFPIPQTIITDNGVQFISKKFENLLSQHNIYHHRTICYNPRGNSIFECSHSDIVAGLC
ncbi:hypothetical protein A0H76_944 [Hepatospora eriocheir]|uniref:Integrase catalytic domain-containing protein n=1 Tax=Hepatospora eriocheir TaxID=1081669 RepID=A0A1X0QHY1_9MICR|nr:hypothetical protein A0H76_944 [Hepatospora eriocheir]